MHSLEKYPSVIVLTNYALPQYRTQARTLGAQYFLDKASEFDRLPEVIQEIAGHPQPGHPHPGPSP
jgi:CheY-like chemotaxis protein